MNSNLRLLIVDDHNLVCNGIKFILTESEISTYIERIDTAYGGEEGISKAIAFDYDLILMDVEMPEVNGIKATSKIMIEKPESKILAISMYGDMERVNGMLNSGALGYVLKDTGVERLIKAIKAVSEGKRFFSNQVALKLIEAGVEDLENPNSKGEVEDINLTRRERQILTLIFRENTNAEIGIELGVSKRTVDAHRLNILKKLGVKNTAGLIKYAVRKGYK
ncbi:MAG: response regulator transcription factor [Flavobacteriales bacterium]|jgi:DNA-binding NarL/FixJ family response regulator|nr:response regulator transcription factor [Flavobacteriales bacterium]